MHAVLKLLTSAARRGVGLILGLAPSLVLSADSARFLSNQYEISSSAALVAFAHAYNGLDVRRTLNEPFLITGQADTRKELNAFSLGNECENQLLECKTSAVRTQAAAEVRRLDEFVEIRVGVNSSAQGGFSIQCDRKLSNDVCSLANRINTSGESTSSAEVATRIKFADDALVGRYWLIVNQRLEGSAARRILELTGSPGSAARLIEKDDQVPIDGGPGRVYVLRAKLQADASPAPGQSTVSAERGSFTVQVRLRPISDLTSGITQAVHTTGVGGVEADQFAGVGVIVRRGMRGEALPLCTGAVVGPRTVLTAAHCLEFLESKSKAEAIWFVEGQALISSLQRAIPISSWEIPNETFPGGYQYRARDKARAVDDVALLYLERPVGTVGHFDLAGLGDVQLPLEATIVTFRTSTDSRYAKEGVLRHAARAAIVAADERAFEYSTNLTDCAGTGGSPIFLVKGKLWRIVGIASFNADCLGDHAMRMDAYSPWIRTRIR